MAFLNWDNAFSVGNSIVDNQHKRLFQLINELHEAMKVGKSKEIMSKIIDDLTNYTIIHFGLEENLMMKNKYPDYPEHKKKHVEFTSKVNDFRKKYNAESSVLSMEVINFLKEWLVYHIKGMDKLYISYISAK